MKFATSYFGSRILRHVREDMRRLRRDGFDVVVHTYSENDFEFYEQTMREIVATSKDAGLEVWLDPWGVGGVFGGEAYSRKAVTEKAWLQLTADNNPLPACCPNSPGFRSFVADWISSACATGADAIFWDEPHFFAGDTDLQAGCYCQSCKRMTNEGGVAGPQMSQQTSVGSLLNWAFPLVQGQQKQNVLCLLPQHLETYPKADIKSLAARDNLGTDPYWFIRGERWDECIPRFSRLVISTAGDMGIQSHIWIQGFKVPSGRESEITHAVVAVAQFATDVIAIWGFEGCAAMSSIACDRPQIAWKSFLRGIELVRNQT